MSGHLDKLKREYLEAPLHQPLNPDVRVSEGGARVTLRVEPSHFYPRDSADAALIFKALHDAAFLAASSLTPGGALLTYACISMMLASAASARRLSSTARSSWICLVFSTLARRFSSSSATACCFSRAVSAAARRP